MKVVLSIVALAAIASARPDVSHLSSGSYLPPSGSYLPSYDGGLGQGQEEKHVYFYGSAGDGEYTRLRINVIPQSKKNTKIIFVKAPHHAGVIPEIIAPPSLAEDKTLVYVLVKKPVDGQSISVPAGLGVKQLKPEVFFLKYNNKHDAEGHIQNGIHGNHVGQKVPDLQNEHAFISTLGNGHGDGQGYGHGGGYGSGVSTHVGSTNHGPTGGSGPY
ncbi:hypothetical protein FQR65_LT03448 [Abscondita terminalis]|nr:hypothetical protein FQR65_LT03448 [Abscondita terminalis]